MPVTYVDGKPTIGYDSVNDKLNTQDADLQTKIDALNTKIDNILNGTSPAITQLSGRNVVETVILNASAITDTTARTAALSVTAYKDFDLLINNTLDQAVKIAFIMGVYGLRIVKSDGTVASLGMTAGYFNVPVDTRNIMLSSLILSGITGVSDYRQWQKFNVNGLTLQYKCDVAPTVGSLSVTLKGVPN